MPLPIGGAHLFSPRKILESFVRLRVECDEGSDYESSKRSRSLVTGHWLVGCGVSEMTV